MLRFISTLFCVAVFATGILVSLSDSIVQAAPPKYRTWTNDTGEFKVEAAFVDLVGDKVKLKKKADGKTITLPLDKLSDSDRGIAKKLKADLDGPKKSRNPFEGGDEGERKTNPFAGGGEDGDETGDGESFAGGSVGNFTKKSIRFGKAKTIRPMDASTKWSIEPDPHPMPKLPFKPKAPTFKFNDANSAFRANETGYFFSDHEPSRVLAVFHMREHRQYQSKVFIGNIETGLSQSVLMPFKMTPFGLSPNGGFALFLQEPGEDTGGFGKARNLAVADASDPDLPCVLVCEPFAVDATGRGSDHRCDIGWAAWADDDNVLALSRQGRLILFNLESGMARWTFMIRPQSKPVLSPGRKYLLVETSHAILYLMETRTGKIIGRLSDGTKNDMVPGDGKTPDFTRLSKFYGYTFSPDGTKLARTGENEVTIWNLTNGKAEEPFYIRGFHSRDCVWIDNTYLLYGPMLVDTVQRVPVWKYNGAIRYMNVYGGGFWYSGNERSDYALVPYRLPHDAVLKLKPVPEEQKYRIRPGIAVKLHVDSAIPEQDKVRRHVLAMIKENGLQLDENAPITLAVKIKTEAPDKATYAQSRFGLPSLHGGGTEITVTLYTMSVAFEKDGETLWKDSMKTTPPSVSTEEIANRSLQDLVNEKSRPTADWYLKMRIPKKIPNENVGQSMFTLYGLR